MNLLKDALWKKEGSICERKCLPRYAFHDLI